MVCVATLPRRRRYEAHCDKPLRDGGHMSPYCSISSGSACTSGENSSHIETSTCLWASQHPTAIPPLTPSPLRNVSQTYASCRKAAVSHNEILHSLGENTGRAWLRLRQLQGKGMLGHAGVSLALAQLVLYGSAASTPLLPGFLSGGRAIRRSTREVRRGEKAKNAQTQ
jgi:hypothetical protein